jgi:cytochrome c
LAGDPAAGEKQFKSKCAICHTVEQGKNKIGPSLFGVVGRKSGSIEGFKYSEANRAANLTWDEPTLDKYLTDPKALVKGTIMTFPGIKNDTETASMRRRALLGMKMAPASVCRHPGGSRDLFCGVVLLDDGSRLSPG